jgi:hypothetical protein
MIVSVASLRPRRLALGPLAMLLARNVLLAVLALDVARLVARANETGN